MSEQPETTSEAKPQAAETPRNGNVVLATEKVVAGYIPEVDILNGVTLRVSDGEIVTLVGPNGAGKSTLIKTVFGLLEPREGQVTYRGEPIGGLKPHAISKLGLAYVPQLDNVFPTLTVEENLLMGGHVRTGIAALFDRFRGTGAAASEGEGEVGAAHTLTMPQARERIDRMYELFPRLGERRKQDAGTMSGGERQMVAMAKALMSDPSVLLLDEPSAGLAPAFVDAIFEKIVDVNAQGVTILMVEQNATRALAMSDRGYVLDLGKERFEGPGRELISDPKVAELYLGGGSRIDDKQDIAEVLGDDAKSG